MAGGRDHLCAQQGKNNRKLTFSHPQQRAKVENRYTLKEI
jgi:hypothetical protein